MKYLIVSLFLIGANSYADILRIDSSTFSAELTIKKTNGENEFTKLNNPKFVMMINGKKTAVDIMYETETRENFDSLCSMLDLRDRTFSKSTKANYPRVSNSTSANFYHSKKDADEGNGKYGSIENYQYSDYVVGFKGSEPYLYTGKDKTDYTKSHNRGSDFYSVYETVRCSK